MSRNKRLAAVAGVIGVGLAVGLLSYLGRTRGEGENCGGSVETFGGECAKGMQCLEDVCIDGARMRASAQQHGRDMAEALKTGAPAKAWQPDAARVLPTSPEDLRELNRHADTMLLMAVGGLEMEARIVAVARIHREKLLLELRPYHLRELFEDGDDTLVDELRRVDPDVAHRWLTLLQTHDADLRGLGEATWCDVYEWFDVAKPEVRERFLEFRDTWPDCTPPA